MPPSSTLHFPARGKFRASPSFTLVEMLVVIAIIAILTAVAVPLIPSLLRANVVNANINTLSGSLERARETAISGNTYVWVAFTDPPATSLRTGTWVAMFESQDGTDPIGANPTAWLTTVTAPGTVGATGTSLQLVGKLQQLAGAKIVDYGNSSLPAALTSQTTTSTADIANPTTLFEPPGMQWTVTPLQNTENYVSPTYFTHAIEFTPDGEAHVQGIAGTWYSNIQFGMIPSVGSNNNDDVLLNVSRLTGKLTVFRP